MQYRKMGNTDIDVSVVGLGAWAIGGDSSWGTSDDDASIKTIHTAYDLGINLVDTAPAYGLGHSEEVVGKALKGRRHDYVLSSKCGLVWGENDEGYPHMQRDGVTLRRNLDPQHLRIQLENSLRRLQTDYIDILITHWQALPPLATPIEDTMDALLSFIKEGKIRAIGISNVTPEQIDTYFSCGDIALVQQKFSLLDRTCEEGIIPKCKEHGISLQAYSPLERGILTGKITMETQASGLAKNGIVWYQPEKRRKLIDMLESFKPLCEKYNTSMASLAVAWTAAQTDNINVLCGARKAEQIADNANGGSLILDAEDIAFMDKKARELIAEA